METVYSHGARLGRLSAPAWVGLAAGIIVAYYISLALLTSIVLSLFLVSATPAFLVFLLITIAAFICMALVSLYSGITS